MKIEIIRKDAKEISDAEFITYGVAKSCNTQAQTKWTSIYVIRLINYFVIYGAKILRKECDSFLLHHMGFRV